MTSQPPRFEPVKLLFVFGLIISCIGEIALVGHAADMPELYYSGIIWSGLDFVYALLFLAIGNLFLFLDIKLRNSSNYFPRSKDSESFGM